jgi:hypothetical protein
LFSWRRNRRAPYSSSSVDIVWLAPLRVPRRLASALHSARGGLAAERTRHDPNKAATAVARSLIELVWHLLITGEVYAISSSFLIFAQTG